MGKPRTVASKDLKSFLNAAKRETRLMGSLERHILTQPFDERSQDVLHPSDLIKPEWCALAAYHALRGNYVETREKLTLRQVSIFAEGHAIHAKWQGWFRDMGILYGMWRDKTGTSWGVAKDVHPSVDYAEVPLHSAKHRISGHADGWIKGLGDDCFIEIKSIGTGTLRFEAPAILAQAEGDLEKAWRNVKQPFRAHQLQGQMYLHLAHLMVEEGLLESAPKEIVFIYELKANQDYKEFVVQYNPEFVADIFDKALDVVWAVDNNRPPMCSIDSVAGCKRCEPYRGGENA
jgi:hypothetical protein